MSAFYYPVLTPAVHRDVTIGMYSLLTLMIATNVVWLLYFIAAIIHNAVLHRRTGIKYKLSYRAYFVHASLISFALNILVYLVALFI